MLSSRSYYHSSLHEQITSQCRQVLKQEILFLGDFVVINFTLYEWLWSFIRFLSWALHIFAFDLAYEPEGWPWKPVSFGQLCKMWRRGRRGVRLPFTDPKTQRRRSRTSSKTPVLTNDNVICRSNPWSSVSTSCWSQCLLPQGTWWLRWVEIKTQVFRDEEMPAETTKNYSLTKYLVAHRPASTSPCPPA